MASSTQERASDTTEDTPASLERGGTGKFNEEFDASRRGSSLVDSTGNNSNLQRATSAASQTQTNTLSRGGTLKKKGSLKRNTSLRRSSSRRSLGAGSVKSLGLGDREKYEGADFLSAFNTPIPTKGSPTEILSNRFQEWRRVLKDLITYFREVQKSHESRSKALASLSSLASNISGPAAFRKEGGINDANAILRQYHRQAISENTKAKTIEDEVIQQLTGLRSDLGQKCKEIKNLSGDFKNSCDKETDATRKAIKGYQEALGMVDTESSATTGRGDPFIIRMGVERQIERQIDEENYLHKAFLNLEHSGRELESIVVGEIQKAYNAYAGILKREADEAYETVDSLRTGPLKMPKDTEWDSFVTNNTSFVDPRMPLRSAAEIDYPGKNAPAAAEVRSGLLERKSKYLKSYTPGWYVLSPTHLHEFKSPDHIASQAPVMSLYLPEQKLGSHSNADSSSHKFMLKGRQTGGMHRGHGWVFRAESRETMMAWYEAIKALTESSGMERDAYVRRHARSISANSLGTSSVSSELDEDEADNVPYSARNSRLDAGSPESSKLKRPQPGGRFPSDLNLNPDLQIGLPPSSGTSSNERDTIAAAIQLPGSTIPSDLPASNLAPPRSPTEEYQQTSYESHHDTLYQTGGVSDSPVIKANLANEHPAIDQTLPGDGHMVDTSAIVAVIAPNTLLLDPTQHTGNSDQESALHPAISPLTVATTSMTVSDGPISPVENLLSGASGTDPSLSNVHDAQVTDPPNAMPGSFGA